MREGLLGRTGPAVRALGAAAACLALACADASVGARGGGRVRDSSQFPTPKQLEKVEAAPLPAEVLDLDVRSVDAWELAGPFPERMHAEPYSSPDDPWSALLEDAARRRAGLVVPTESLYCVARELGRFQFAQHAAPSASLRGFITARCNAPVANVASQSLSADAPSSEDSFRLYEQWKDQASEVIRDALKGGPQLAGIWFGHDQGKAMMVVTTARREVLVEPLSPVPTEDGVLELRGEVLTPVTSVVGLANHGRLGVAECERLEDATLPSFHLRCSVDREDESALVSEGYIPPHRLLGRHALVVLAWPQGRTSAVYHRPVYAESWPMLDAEHVVGDFVELLNRVRREAGLPALALDAGQSETATRLAPHYFASAYGASDETTSDLIALGMLAGWTVDGIVQEGHFGSALAIQTNDLSDLISSALESPSGRHTLLATDVERIAVGPILHNGEDRAWIAAMFGTYALFSEKQHDAVARQVFARLDREREQRGSTPPEKLGDVTGLCQRVASSVQGGEDPKDAMNDLLRASAGVLGRSVSGWVAEVSRIEDLNFPEEILTRPSLGVAVSVSHRRVEGDAWGRYVVMLVIADPESHGV